MRTMPTWAGAALAARLLFAFSLPVLLLSPPTSWAAGQAIQIPSDVPYKNSTMINSRVTSQCLDLGPKLGRFLHEYSEKYDVETVPVETVDPKAKGRVLVVQITSTASIVRAFVVQHKSMSARAELFEDGRSKGSASFSRDSMAGFGRGYKRSCSALRRCTKALGKDIAGWLRDRER